MAVETITWTPYRAVTPDEFNRIEDGLQWLYDRISGGVGRFGWFPHRDVPQHLLCDGSVITSNDPRYVELVAMLKTEAGADTSHPYYHADSDKAVLPDLVGRFTRGMGGSRKSGEYQGNAVRNHLHQTVIGSHDHEIIRGDGVNHAGIQVQKQTTSYTPPEAVDTSSTDLGTKTSGDPTSGGASEERPDNVTMWPMIRY